MNKNVWKDVLEKKVNERECVERCSTRGVVGLWEIRNVKNQSVKSCVVNEVRKCVLEERCVNDWLC